MSLRDIPDAIDSVESLQELGWGDLALRPYQLEGVNWLINCCQQGHGCILGDEMGLGKTCQTIALLTYLNGNQPTTSRPHLVVCPRSVLENWGVEFSRFSPKTKTLCFVGDKDVRNALSKKIKASKKEKGTYEFDALITTYELCLKDHLFLKTIPWNVLVVDEAHRLKNQDSLLYKTLEEWDISCSVLLTGTPVQNNLRELYALLSFIAPRMFRMSKVDKFVETYSNTEKEEGLEELHELLKPYLLRRTKNNVLADLPNKTEVVLYHGLSGLQKKLYKGILTRDLEAFNSTAVQPRLMNILMQLRKCVNHPYLFDGVEPEPFELGEHLVEASGKLVLIDKLLCHLKQSGHKVLLFSQMTHMLDILQDYLGYRDFTYERLDGSVRGEERFLSVRNFNENDETFVFLLSTKAGGQGINLTAADTVIFVDSDFNPQNDLQAAARAHRIGQTRPVKVIRLIGRNSVEEIILARAEQKLKLTDKVIESGQFTAGGKHVLFADNRQQLQDVLRFGVDKLLNADEDDSSDMDLEKYLGISIDGEWQLEEEVEEEEAPQTGEDKMDEDAPQSMYVFEGTDYSKDTTVADRKALEELLEVERIVQSDVASGERTLRVKKEKSLVGPLPDLQRKPRKQLTPQELEEHKRRRKEAAEKRAKLAEEQEIRRAQEQRKKREDLWKANNYTSCNVASDSEEEDSQEEHGEEEEEENGRQRAIQYVSGDVTHPSDAGTLNNIIVHCADDAGQWGRGGLFSALSARSPNPEAQYQLAGRMKDLALGDCHLVCLDNDTEDCHEWLALLIAQHRDKRNNLSGIKLSALRVGLEKIHSVAKKHKASVHLPRIGHNTPGFNWYGTERLIQKHLASTGIPTFIYYFPRRQKLKRKVPPPASPPSSPPVSPLSSPSTIPSMSAPGERPLKFLKRLSSGGTSARSSSPLPSYFMGCSIHLHHIPDDDSKYYRRYIVAFDGDVHAAVSPSTTHVVISQGADREILKGAVCANPDVVIVTSQWMADCLNMGRLLETDTYQILLE
ncbi:chromodomain-helicase-DNA-binding protein 1-like isoform X1 [Haliotis rufescens]|uniref:chromodomain-helicase-DNA-binding protein 1-like isoform X1 n=1 Tax=Haliotis rufescens TaxID=6454 RepID=UPI00201F862E|nr:chromodomain-helicase-DNA-binding protein 1-like isoform X1 [Haliotis rufescens]